MYKKQIRVVIKQAQVCKKRSKSIHLANSRHWSAGIFSIHFQVSLRGHYILGSNCSIDCKFNWEKSKQKITKKKHQLYPKIIGNCLFFSVRLACSACHMSIGGSASEASVKPTRHAYRYMIYIYIYGLHDLYIYIYI